MKSIRVKVTLKSKNFGFYIVEDYTDYARELIKHNNVFSSNNVKMTEENISNYFKSGEYTSEEIEGLNGDHFLYGFIESISQNEKYADLFYLFEEDPVFVVELL